MLKHLILFVGFLLFVSVLMAQPGPQLSWIWVNGNQYGSLQSHYGTKGVEAAENKPPGRYDALNWTDKSGNFWLFGGTFGGNYMYNDLWKYNPQNNKWTWMNGDSTVGSPAVYGTITVPSVLNNPGARSGAAAWSDKDGNLWLFGGNFSYVGNNYGDLNDVWKYDVHSGIWTWMKGSNSSFPLANLGVKGIANSSNTPGASIWGTSWTDKEGGFWFYGGFSRVQQQSTSQPYSNKLWKFDSDQNMWTWMKGDSVLYSANYGTQGLVSPDNCPGERIKSTPWVDKDGKFWLFGGGYAAGGVGLNDLWKYDPLTNNWVWVKGKKPPVPLVGYWPAVYGIKDSSNINNNPGGRFASNAWTVGEEDLYLFGGEGTVTFHSLGKLNDLWRYHIPSNTWTWIKGDSIIDTYGHYGTMGVADSLNEPPGREQAVNWKDDAGTAWIFGGYSAFNDLWKINIPPTVSLSTEVTLHAAAAGQDILVGWETIREVNTDHFVLERAADRFNFTPLQTVPAAGNSTVLKTYSYLDQHPLPDSNYYRLKILRTDGSFIYSNIVAVKINQQIGILIYPNPPADILTIHLNGLNDQTLLQIFDAAGKKLVDENFVVNGNVTHEISIKKFPKGVYVLKLKNASGYYKEKFLKL